MVMPVQAPQARSQEELDVFLNLTTTTDPTLLIRRVNTFATRFPKSELLGIAYQHQMHAYQQVRNFDGMLAAGEKALAANQDNLSTLLTLAPVLAHEAAHRPDKTRLLKQAEDYAQRALEGIDKTQIPRKITLERWEGEKQQMQAEAHSVLGTVALERGQFPDAIREFQTAVSLSPNGGTECLGLGNAYAASGSKADAEKALRRAADLGPEPVRKQALEELRKLDSAK
jgi:tetratricopeptide (TPR) repeat protein